MPPPTGTEVVGKTVVVKAGETFDGGGKLFNAGPALGDGGQSEGQKHLFSHEDGSTLNRLQFEGVDGTHIMGDAHVKDVWIRDVSENAFTKTRAGNVLVDGGGAFNASDKIFQSNAGGALSINSFQAVDL